MSENSNHLTNSPPSTQLRYVKLGGWLKFFYVTDIIILVITIAVIFGPMIDILRMLDFVVEYLVNNERLNFEIQLESVFWEVLLIDNLWAILIFFGIYLLIKRIKFLKKVNHPEIPKKIVKIYWLEFYVQVILKILLAFKAFNYSDYIFSDIDETIEAQKETLIEMFSLVFLIFFRILWTSYFKRSKRVLHTYGANA
ncbi:DUF2569 family protein [Taylorella asinigenitalis]|uniref:Transmembrane protein n=1 Tax=Taylorella asinigenitalis (strain MCE3) TaxID=1008459 RepID=G4QCD2_TAYAM|nr:DUF2569 family protein [Taylorella asinigenitalis]AEP36062.1 hypothetical protein TASI_0279 [Taylorella asinigenitalis MCE3]